uniref:Uncharacterized protein n=1 Tax=Arundo donax TaxID=35708 RepID=A0A0A9CC28_ARUDO
MESIREILFRIVQLGMLFHTLGLDH